MARTPTSALVSVPHKHDQAMSSMLHATDELSSLESAENDPNVEKSDDQEATEAETFIRPTLHFGFRLVLVCGLSHFDMYARKVRATCPPLRSSYTDTPPPREDEVDEGVCIWR
ncbi:hypothetical protein VP1G_10803 [Cytospora mali]|uniref:Uncharacterized protein n=1 Tax=Cytospora mali TaxID=578113 RepID=A0A194UXE5_CYTMA|nr:hypothetical protein VP1G_10803 [Valsa mali var. pyri (nom. inval.)]